MENEEMNTVENQVSVPYFVHEAEMARQERTIKRLWILSIIIFLALVITNAGWIVYESQYEDVVTTQEVEQEVDTGNGDAFVHGIGNLYGTGTTESQNDNQNEAEENERSDETLP